MEGNKKKNKRKMKRERGRDMGTDRKMRGDWVVEGKGSGRQEKWWGERKWARRRGAAGPQ